MTSKKVLLQKNFTFLCRRWIFQAYKFLRMEKNYGNNPDVLVESKMSKKNILLASILCNSSKQTCSMMLRPPKFVDILSSKIVVYRHSGICGNIVALQPCRHMSSDVTRGSHSTKLEETERNVQSSKMFSRESAIRLKNKLQSNSNIDNVTLALDSTLARGGSDPTLDQKVIEVHYNDTAELKQITKLFPAPKTVLHNLFHVISQQTNAKAVTPQYKLIKDGKESAWLCMYHTHWPEEKKFIATDKRKSLASHKAAIVALAWLKKNEKLSKSGAPVIFGREEIKTITKKSLPVLSLGQPTIGKMENMIKLHEEQIMPRIVDDFLYNKTPECESEEEPEETDHVNLKRAKRQRFLGAEQYLAKEKIELPISAYKNDFIRLMKENQIVIVKGEPGCGKSTRIPQYVLAAWAEEGGETGETCRIAVTQPRRIAAISLAERVAGERDEPVGHIIGYQVRLKSNFNPSTGRVLYCTTGILLRHFQSDPNLSSFSHVILDEAHERDVNTDLLMNLLRTACKRNPKLKVTVMSATIDTEMFSDYFDKAPILNIPGFTYPVKQYFLDSCSQMDLSKTLDMCEGNVPSVVHKDVATVIQFIYKCKGEGAILCFLPGWEDMKAVLKLLPNTNDLVVYCLHSRLQDSEQWKVFSRPPPGIRKVVLATNIAETSVTIDDVVYVIDTGIHKEQRFDAEKGVSSIDNHWISKASVNQRKGRAGRVQAGHCFHLYTKAKYDSLPDYSLPEIQRTSLTKILLDSKVFTNNLDALEFAGSLPTPPEKEATLRAVLELKELEMLDKEENLTPLGKTCANFQLEPRLAKAMVNAVIFKCVTPVVDIVTLFSADTELFASGLMNKDHIRSVKRSYSRSSDHLAMMRLFERWLGYSQEGNTRNLYRLIDEANLVKHKLPTMEKLRGIHFDYLDLLYDVLPISDDLSDNDEMVKAVLFSGVGTVLQHRNWDIVKNKLKNNVNCFLTRNNHKATITTESVNHRRSNYPTNFLFYIYETRSNIRRTTLIRECSLIPNISVLLFCNKSLEIKEVDKESFSKDIPSQDQVKIWVEDTNIEFLCDRLEAETLVKCKYALMAGYRYYVRQLTHGGINDSNINTSWDSILHLVGDILNTYSVKN